MPNQYQILTTVIVLVLFFIITLIILLLVIGLNHLFIIDLNNYKISKFNFPSKINFNKIDSVDDELFLSFSEGIFTFNLVNKRFEEYRFDDLFNKNFPRGFSDIEMVEDQFGFLI